MGQINSSDVISKVLYMQLQLNSRITNFVSEDALRKEITKEHLERLKESLYYIIDEQIHYLL